MLKWQFMIKTNMVDKISLLKGLNTFDNLLDNIFVVMYGFITDTQRENIRQQCIICYKNV